jgi:hypothetical protein
LDIVYEYEQIKSCGSRPGILGSTVIQERVTEVLDTKSFVKMIVQNLGLDHFENSYQSEVQL